MPVEINFLANVRNFLRGTDDVDAAFSEVAGSLDDLARDAQRSGAKLGDEISDGAKDAERGVEKLERSFEELADAAKRETRKAGDSVKDNMGKGSPASEGLDEFKSEAMSNFSEVASSFTGDMSQMADGVQGLTGGLAGALTPGIGIPVAILGAAAGAWLASWQQSAEKSEERISTMYDAFLEAGSKYLTDEQVNQAIADLAGETEEWASALQIAKDTALPIQTVLRAMVGDQGALNEAISAETAQHQATLDKINLGSLAMEDKAAAQLLELQRHDQAIGKLQQIATDTDTAAAKAAAVAAAFGTGNAQLDNQIAKIQTLAEQVRGLNETPVNIRIGADTTGLDGYLAGLEGRRITVNMEGQITKVGQNLW